MKKFQISNFKFQIFFLFLIPYSLFLIPDRVYAAKMALSPGGAEFIQGCVSKVDIVVNTEGENSQAADAFLVYNPNEIEILDQAPGVPGVQIKFNGIYESYPGNIVQNGKIWMTAFNRVGFFNGRGVLGSIYFKPKSGVEKTAISFSFSPGNSTDSNVANASSLDVLNGVYNGVYTFKKGSCGKDKTPPKITKYYPEKDAMLAPLNTDIALIIEDEGSGVNLDTLSIEVNGEKYSSKGERLFLAEARPLGYKIVIKPLLSLPEKTGIVIKVNAQDMEGNAMEDVYGFNKLIPVEYCQNEIPECPVCETCAVSARPAAPRQVILWWPLILLILSLILNLILLLFPEEEWIAHKKNVKWFLRKISEKEVLKKEKNKKF